MIGSAARYELDVFDLVENGWCLDAECILQDFVFRNPAVQRFPDDSRLLINLFQHEVLVGALIAITAAARHCANFAFDLLAVVPNFIAVTGNSGNVSLFKVDKLIGHLAERMWVRGNEVLSDPDTNNQRAA